MKIRADHEKLQYSGRIDWSDPQIPVFVYPCTSLGMRFTGEQLKVRVRNRNEYWDNYLGCIIDGKQVTLPVNKEGETLLEIPVEETADGVHDMLLFKRQDSCHEIAILELEIGDEDSVLDMPPKSGRKIEVYGDSVSAGEVSEAVDYVGKVDPEHNGQYSNSWYSYAWITARKLNAQIHDIAQGGIALMDNTGWFHEPEAVGMETAWNKIHYNTVLAEPMAWDFSLYTPQVVIVAIGQNDSHPTDYMKDDYDGEQAETWRAHYKEFLGNLRSTYPEAHIICITTLLGHDKAWDDSIGAVVEEMKDDRISQYLFKRNGKGTPGHLRIPEAEEMAEELASYINTLHVEGWE
ncbi:MAG: GDSL-type esterase/lipase family protein [Lachnospiraceae bacterium]|nr:GDSL-type esterase/lipase family protein [Lachnospiraceae bacterium]